MEEKGNEKIEIEGGIEMLEMKSSMNQIKNKMETLPIVLPSRRKIRIVHKVFEMIMTYNI